MRGAASGSDERILSPKELLLGSSPRKRLNQWLATGICGNDITSSCLYASGIATVYAGVLAPVALLLVSAILYLYKKVYTEVVEALPLNGGTYNCLLNCTSKLAAAMAACMTILSYIATAVTSARTAVEYMYSAFPLVNLMEGTIAVLAIFATLAIMGIAESAVVALVIFVFHIATLGLLCLVGFVNLPLDFHILQANLGTLPTGYGLLVSLSLGFSAALVGISGFETSANFVEEQEVGVFRKTLRNMLVAVLVFNPLVSIISLNLLPLNEMVVHKDHLISEIGYVIGGATFRKLIALDAMIVLSGAVLTSFVGVSGLIHRMALDQCLPRFFLKRNRRGTYHRIIIGFFLLCTSILLVTKGSLLSLAGVYTISFLGVMTLFGLGNILLKVRRKELKRTYRAGWITTILASTATSLGMMGNVVIDYNNLFYFLRYFIPTALVIIGMYLRIPILKGVLQMLNEGAAELFRLRAKITDRIVALTSQRMILFMRHGGLAGLHTALEYILKNESSRSVIVVHLFSDPSQSEEQSLRQNLKIMQEIFSDLKIELIVREARFTPEVIDAISEEFGVAKNNILVGAPEKKHDFSIQDLGGVRVIF